MTSDLGLSWLRDAVPGMWIVGHGPAVESWLCMLLDFGIEQCETYGATVSA